MGARLARDGTYTQNLMPLACSIGLVIKMFIRLELTTTQTTN